MLYSVITTYGSYLRGESRPDHSRQSHSYQENEGISRPSGASVSFFVRSQQKAAEERKKKKKKTQIHRRVVSLKTTNAKRKKAASPVASGFQLLFINVNVPHC